MATSRLPRPTLGHDEDGRTVASYADVRGASLAMRRLRERGLGDGVFVRPASLSAFDHAFVLTSEAANRRRAMVAGGLTTGLLLVVSGMGIQPLVAGVVIGLAVLAFDHLRLRWLRTRAHRTSKLVYAERFDIVSTRATGQTEHALATWWDPEAPVARRRVAASVDANPRAA